MASHQVIMVVIITAANIFAAQEAFRAARKHEAHVLLVIGFPILLIANVAFWALLRDGGFWE